MRPVKVSLMREEGFVVNSGQDEQGKAHKQSARSAVKHCVIADPKTGPVEVPVLGLDTKGAVLDCSLVFQANEYIDAALELETGERHSLFAHVLSSGEDGLRLRWLHFDPGEDKKLAVFLGMADAHPGLPVKSKKTRKVVRPSGRAASVQTETAEPDAQASATRSKRKVVRPSGRHLPTTSSSDEVAIDLDDGLDLAPLANKPARSQAADTKGTKRKTRKVVKPSAAAEGAQALEPFAEDDDSGSNRAQVKRKTRRVIKPQTGRSDTQQPFADDEYAPADDAKGPSENTPTVSAAVLTDDTTAHNVVLASTQKFEELKAKTSKHRKTKRHNIVGEDGRLDVGASIRNSAKTVSASDLASRHDQVRVLNMKTIKALIQDAVAEAIKHLGSQLDENEKKRLLEEAEEEFQERMNAFKAENKGLQAQAENLQAQLERAQKLLDDEKQRTIEADQFTVSDAGLADMEKHFERIVSRTASDGQISGEVEDQLKSIVGRLLDEEREHIAEQARQAQGEAIELLERKVGRLAKSLNDTEQERDRAQRQMAAMHASGGGALSNVMEAGLDDADPDKEHKLELLKDIFKQNKELRESLQASGVEIKARKKPVVKEVQEIKPEASADEASEAEESELIEAAEATEATGDADDDRTESADDLVAADEEMNPDDMPWEPGMSFSQEIAGDNEDEDDGSALKKMDASAAIASFKMPPLQRKASEPSAEQEDEQAQAEASLEEEQEELINPDDMPWEPGMSFSQDIVGDNENEDDDSSLKKMDAKAAIANFKMPPLNRDG